MTAIGIPMGGAPGGAPIPAAPMPVGGGASATSAYFGVGGGGGGAQSAYFGVGGGGGGGASVPKVSAPVGGVGAQSAYFGVSPGNAPGIQSAYFAPK
ncbi:hypothetical protein KIN20_001274 [Parelaphostrongylus tenuis]|uniref:Uncharacterized protein n=1 Tax=Parelaphostrongylus tenuis TaxID=148309 RepID=A0AAD5MLY9_PARTN|nr:hypothetical protein KIN20_001274 [Parelaphostrongylus tenuis]